jgi:hypothetical protein
VYRNAPATEDAIAVATHLGSEQCRAALESLITKGRVVETRSAAGVTYSADRFEVPVGAALGWEAAVLDHFQAVVTAIINKLRRGQSSGADRDLIGGSTWSLDVWPGHPLEQEAKTLLKKVRASVEDLRRRIDAHNATVSRAGARERVVFYAGQNVRDDTISSQEGAESEDEK